MRVRKLSEVPVAEQAAAEGVAYVGHAVMVEQRETHRNAQEVHGVRKYSEIFHPHRQEQGCGDLCEFWSPE